MTINAGVWIDRHQAVVVLLGVFRYGVFFVSALMPHRQTGSSLSSWRN